MASLCRQGSCRTASGSGCGRFATKSRIGHVVHPPIEWHQRLEPNVVFGMRGRGPCLSCPAEAQQFFIVDLERRSRRAHAALPEDAFRLEMFVALRPVCKPYLPERTKVSQIMILHTFGVQVRLKTWSLLLGSWVLVSKPHMTRSRICNFPQEPT